MAISAKTAELGLTIASDGFSALRRQYGTGPVQLTGAPDALYDRHLSFDHVVVPATASPRQPYEELARSVQSAESSVADSP